MFSSGTSFALIKVLNVPTGYFGYGWAFGVTGYMLGTLTCRRLLVSVGMERALSWGSTMKALAGLMFARLVMAGL